MFSLVSTRSPHALTRDAHHLVGSETAPSAPRGSADVRVPMRVGPRHSARVAPRQRFRTRYQETPGLLAAQAYDTLLICAQVLKAGAHTPVQLRDGLLRVRNFAGVSGLTSIRDKRDAEKVLYLLTVKGSQIVQFNA